MAKKTKRPIIRRSANKPTKVPPSFKSQTSNLNFFDYLNNKLGTFWEKGWFQASYLILICLLYLINCKLSNPSAFDHPQFIAEDGCVFYQDAYNDGWKSIFYNYAGYKDIIIRIFAYLSTILVDMEFAPHFFCITTYLINVCAMLYLWFRVRESTVAKYLICSFYLLGPFGSEMYLWLTNSHFLPSILLLAPFFYPSESKKIIVLDSLILLFIGFNGSYSVILAPVIGFICLRRLYFKKYDLLFLSFIYLIPAVSQLYTISQIGAEARTNGMGSYSWEASVHYGTHFFYNNVILVLGNPSLMAAKYKGLFKTVNFIFVIYLIFASYMAWNNERYLKVVALLSCVILNSFATMYAWKDLPFAIVPPANPVFRYLAISEICIIFAVIVNLNPKKFVWIILFFVGYINSTYNFAVFNKKRVAYEDLNWKQEVANFKMGKSCKLATQYKNEHFVKIKNCHPN